MYTLTTMDKNNFVKGIDLNGNHDLNFLQWMCIW
jgi:hypothetical protein